MSHALFRLRQLLYSIALVKSGEQHQSMFFREYQRSQFVSADQIRALQLSRLRHLLLHASRHCPFYRLRFRDAGFIPEDLRTLDDLRILPVLEKRDLQLCRDQLLADNQSRSNLLLNQTGGSTGTPVSFFFSRNRLLSRTAATLRHNLWTGWNVGDKVAVLWGAPHDRLKPTLLSRLRNHFLDRQLFLDAGHLTEDRLLDFYRQLVRFRPKIILAYARTAVLFAKFLQSRNLVPSRPHAIITSAEMLVSEERALLQQVFGCSVFNRYGSREFSVIASECSAHEGLHVMAEGLYLEIVQGNTPVPPGQPGEVLVTDLLNYAMPLIRYRIGDVASWLSGTCHCGRGLPRLGFVSGRVTDFLVGSDGRAVSGAFLTIAVVAQRVSLGQVQVLQKCAGQVTYRVKPGPDFSAERDLQYLVQVTRQHLGEATQVDWELVDEIAPQPSGKFQFSSSQVVPDFLKGSR